MGILKKLSKYVLPEKIDFFGKISEQIDCTTGIVYAACEFYNNQQTTLPPSIEVAFATAKENRQEALFDLNRTFITPVDKEAISRLYFQLNSMVLKVKHLYTEMKVYEVFNLNPYQSLLNLLSEEAILLQKGFKLLVEKKHSELHLNTDELLHLTNKFSLDYAKTLNELFQETNTRKVFETHEILFQLKDINHTIVDANYAVEDILFKMN